MLEADTSFHVPTSLSLLFSISIILILLSILCPRTVPVSSKAAKSHPRGLHVSLIPSCMDGTAFRIARLTGASRKAYTLRFIFEMSYS